MLLLDPDPTFVVLEIYKVMPNVPLVEDDPGKGANRVARVASILHATDCRNERTNERMNEPTTMTCHSGGM